MGEMRIQGTRIRSEGDLNELRGWSGADDIR